MYATVAQLKAVIPARDLELLAGFDVPPHDPDTLTDAEFDALQQAQVDGRIQQALADATAEINGYIAKVTGGRVLDPAPHILTVICRDLAMHRLYLNLGHEMKVYDGLRKSAIATLKDIASGATAIGDDGDGNEQITSPGVAMTDGPERLLTRDSLTGF